MTPQERQLIDNLFDRLATVENQPRDAQAVAAIAEGLRRAPNAVYALVQTVLVQDEALTRASERIEALEHDTAAAAPAPSGSFLDAVRGSLFGQGQPRSSVPPSGGAAERPAWNSGAAPERMQPQMPPEARPASGGGSFLSTAAATATGVVGGALLMNSIRGLMGAAGSEKGHGLTTDTASGSTGPWGAGGDSGKDGLARDAGLNDIGSGGTTQRLAQQDDTSAGDTDDDRLDQASDDAGDDEDDYDDYDDDDDDDGYDDGDDSDFA